jgi:hypothetical protein
LTKYVGSYPKHPEADARGFAWELGQLFTTALDTDVHFVAYTNDLQCRLSTRIFDPENAAALAAANARMNAAVFDVDDPVAHETGAPARPEWWNAEKDKLSRLWDAHPGFFAYRSHGGYRIDFALAAAVAIRSHEDADTWKVTYVSWCRYLKRRFGISADLACKDWTRCFRAPYVVRDGVRQAWEALGDSACSGVWAPVLEPSDRATVKKRDPGHYGRVEPVPLPDPSSPYGHARIRGAVEYLRTAALSIQGQTGRNTMFGVCAVLVRRMRLPIDVAEALIEAIYNPRLAEAGTGTWSNAPSRHGMSITERLEKARDTGHVPPGSVLDEASWLQLGGEGVSTW